MPGQRRNQKRNKKYFRQAKMETQYTKTSGILQKQFEERN
jgi:hypothetical protein